MEKPILSYISTYSSQTDLKMCELFWSVSDIVSVVFIIIELKCFPKCTGLEGIRVRDALKIAFGWKELPNKNDSACSRIRQNIVKYIFIPRIGIGFAFCLTEFGLLCADNVENLANFSPTLKSMVAIFVLLFLYLAAMFYNACCTNNFESIPFHMGLVVLFKLLDFLVNGAMLMLAYEYTYKTAKPGIDITYVIYVYSFFDVTVCAIQLLKSTIFTIRKICFETETEGNSNKTDLDKPPMKY